MKYKIVNVFNLNDWNEYNQSNEDKTIPNEVRSLQELLEKFTYNGVLQEEYREGEYDDDDVDLDDDIDFSYRNLGSDVVDINDEYNVIHQSLKKDVNNKQKSVNE